MIDTKPLYLVVIEGKPQGPYRFDELKKLSITADTFVKSTVMDDYKEAAEIEEIRNMMDFKMPQPTFQYYASFDQRLLAWAIDYFVIIILYAVIIAFLIWLLNDKELQILTLIAGIALIFISKLVYTILADVSTKQGTLGKQLMNIRVFDEFGQRMSLGLSFQRNIFKVLNLLTFGIGYLACFFTKKHQALHDYLSHTLVVKDRL